MGDPVSATGLGITSFAALVQTFDFYYQVIDVTEASSKHQLVRRLRPIVRGVACSFVDSEKKIKDLMVEERAFGSTVRAILAKTCVILFRLCRDGQHLKVGAPSRMFSEKKLPERVTKGENEAEKKSLLEKYDLYEEGRASESSVNQLAARMTSLMRETSLQLLKGLLDSEYVRDKYQQQGFHLSEDVRQFGLSEVKGYFYSLKLVYDEFDKAVTRIEKKEKTTLQQLMKDNDHDATTRLRELAEAAGQTALKEAHLDNFDKVRLFSATEGDVDMTPTKLLESLSGMKI